MGGKGSGGNKRKEYHGTIAGAVGEGPAYSLEWIIIGGKTVFTGSLAKPVGDYSDITLIGMGSARFYWGTETQTADPTLTAYDDHPAYRGIVYIVFKDCSWGDGAGPLSVEVCWRRGPLESIMGGYYPQTDGNCTNLPTGIAAELLTSWSWGNFPTAKINATSFQTLAAALHLETIATTNRYRTSIAPFYNEQMSLKAALTEIAEVSKVFIRLGVDGRIEAGQWKRDGSVSGVAALTYDDVDSAKFETPPIDGATNSFMVGFRNAAKHHKKDFVSEDNTAMIRAVAATRRKSADRSSLLIWDDQARMHGSDLLRDISVPVTTVVLQCRRWKAVNPGGTPIRPGDYFTFPMEEQGDAPDIRLFRCIRRSFDTTGPIELTGELETNGAIRNVTPAVVPVFVPDVTPPINYSRVLAVPPSLNTDAPGVAVLAARPADMAASFDVQYCASAGGDYAYIGSQRTFATPLNLYASCALAASTIRLQLLSPANGISTRRDQSMLLNWNGGAGEAADDHLLICVVKKDGGGNIVLKADGITPWVEFLSVSGPVSAVTTDVYDVPVLRGRRGTVAADFNAGSFPDAWTNYEAWVIPLSGLTSYEHPDLEAQIVSRANAYFELIPVGPAGAYDPNLAWTERVRRVTASLALQEFFPQATGGVFYPVITFLMPSFRLPTVYNGNTGNNGQRLAYLKLLQWATSAPTLPVGTSIYTWATGAFTLPGTANGWTQAPGTGTVGQILWEIMLVIGNTNTTTTDTSPNWNTAASPYPVGGNGLTGGNFTMLVTNAQDLGGGTVKKTAGTNGSFDAQGYSQERFTGGAYCTFRGDATAYCYLMAGLDAAPEADANYPIDYSWHLVASGLNCYVYKNGVVVGSSYGTFSATDVFSVLYDNVSVTWLLNGVVKYSEAAASGLKLGFDSSLAYRDGSGETRLYDCRFGPQGAKGGAGVDAIAYSLNLSAASLKKSTAGVFTPSTLTASATSQTGAGAPAAYAGRFKIYENGSGTASYTSSGDESSKVYTPSGSGVTEIKVELYLAGGTTTLIKSQIVPVAVDGTGSGTLGTAAGDVSGVTTTITQLCALTATADGALRSVLITGRWINSSGTAGTLTLYLYLDGVSVASWTSNSFGSGGNELFAFNYTHTPSAASHTWSLRGNAQAGGTQLATSGVKMTVQ